MGALIVVLFYREREKCGGGGTWEEVEEAMTRSVCEFLYELYAKTIVLVTYMLIQLILIIRYLKSNTPPISTTQYLSFIEEKNPAIRCTTRLKAEHIDCRVCLSEFQEGEKVRNLNCRHTFHKDCLDQWLQQYCATCPLCRHKVLPDHVVANYNLLQNQVQEEEEVYDGNDHQLIFLLSALRGGSTLHTYL